MRIPRVFVDHPLEPDVQLDLPSGAANHLSKVLRMRPGQRVALFNNQDGRDYEATLCQVNKKTVSAAITAAGPVETRSSLSIHLALGISKGDRMDYAIQKSVELGVDSITPLFTERVNVRLDRKRIERKLAHWTGVTVSACEQSGRRWIPGLNGPLDLRTWLSDLQHQTLMLDHESNLSLRGLDRPGQHVALLVGPEGGLTEDEKQLAYNAGCNGIRLGQRIMRTETAPVAAIAAIQTLWGDFC